jgi:uncharacterized protein YndB with AHSA1/START domain
MDKLTVERSIWINASRERVWSAITDPEQLGIWFAPGAKWEIPNLKIGGTVKFYNTETDIAVHIIEVLNPPREFSLSWEEEGRGMRTTFLLEEEKNGTRVTIVESGFELLREEIRQKRFNETTKGYGMSLQNLKAHVEAQH